MLSMLIQRLLSRDNETDIVVLDVNPPPQPIREVLRGQGTRLHWLESDIRDAEGLRQLLAEEAFDVIVHGAAITHSDGMEFDTPHRFIEVNVDGTVRLLDAIRHSPSRTPLLLHISSCAVYGDGQPGLDPQPETLSLQPVETYGISKLAAEMLVERYRQLYAMRVVRLRPGKVFGPGERPTGARTVMSAPYEAMKAVISAEPLLVTERTMAASLDWLSSTDLVDAILLVVDGMVPDGGVYNIGSGRRTTFQELARLAESAAGVPVIRIGPDGQAVLDVDPASTFGRDARSDISSFSAATGWKPQKFSERFHEYHAWAKDHWSELG